MENTFDLCCVPYRAEGFVLPAIMCFVLAGFEKFVIGYDSFFYESAG
jgi:hypothetical protein